MKAIAGMPIAEVGLNTPHDDPENRFGFFYTAEDFATKWPAENKPAGWSPENSLYHVEFGINDINNSDENYHKWADEMFAKYLDGMETVCHLGGQIAVWRRDWKTLTHC